MSVQAAGAGSDPGEAGPSSGATASAGRAQPLFRQSAYDRRGRVASIDGLLKLSAPHQPMATVGVVAALAAVAVWSLFGRLPTGLTADCGHFSDLPPAAAAAVEALRSDAESMLIAVPLSPQWADRIDAGMSARVVATSAAQGIDASATSSGVVTSVIRPPEDEPNADRHAMQGLETAQAAAFAVVEVDEPASIASALDSEAGSRGQAACSVRINTAARRPIGLLADFWRGAAP